MKVEVIEKEEEEEKQYPFIGKGIYCGKIVYFYAEKKGIVLQCDHETSGFSIGEHYDRFDMEVYKKLGGKVIMEND